MPRELDAGDLHEFYANFFKVGYNAAEFLLHFGRRLEEGPGEFYQQIVTSPGHAKTFSNLLQKSLGEYESRFGKIPEDEGP